MNRKLRRRRRRTSASRLHLETLESRRLLATQLLYGGSGQSLSLQEATAAADDIEVFQPAADVVRIQLMGGATFDAGSSTSQTGLTYEVVGMPDQSTFADIDVSSANAINGFMVDLGADNDALSVALADSGSNNVADLSLAGGDGIDSILIEPMDVAGQLVVDAESINVDAATVALTGDMTWQGPVILEADTQLSASNVTFQAAVDSDGSGPWSLLVDTSNGGLTWFQDDVGAMQPLNNLETNADGQTDLDGSQVVTAGDQDYRDPVVLTTNVTLDTDNVTFHSTVDSDGSGPWSLLVNSSNSGLTWFQDDVGVSQPLNNLETNADGQTDLDGSQVVTAGDQDYRDPVVLTTNVTLDTDNVTFHGTVDSDGSGPWSLLVNTSNSGLTWFQDDVGVSQPLNNLETNTDGQTDLDGSQVVTAGDQDYRDPVVLTTNVTIDTDNVTFHGTVDSDGSGPWSLLVNTSNGGLTWFQDDVGVSQPLNNLETNADGRTDLDGAQVVTAGDQDYRDPVVLTTNVIIETSNVTFHGTVDSDTDNSWNLTINTNNGGLTWFRDNVGVTQPLNNLETNADGRTDLDGAQVRTDSDQDYRDPVILTTNVTIDTDNVTFHGTVDSDGSGPWSLLVNTSSGGLTRFQDDVGVMQPLNNLETNADGQTDLDGSQVVTAGDQDYRDPVVLTTNVTIDTDNVTFHGTVDSDGSGPWSLLVNTSSGGLTRFQDDVGVSQPLNHLETNADGRTDLDGSQVVTAGDQDYRDPVVLTTNVTVNTGNVTFHSTVDSDTNGPWNLTVDTSNDGLTWFQDDVGVSQPLNNLETNADGQTDLDGSQVVTAGDQDYRDPVVLTTHVTIDTDNVTFHSTVDSDTNGPWNLTVDTSNDGLTWFQDDVGVSQSLNNLETNADGRTDLDGAQVRTDGDQNYNDPVVLTTNVTIETSNVTFHGTVDSDTDNSWNLTINTNNGGLTWFRDNVGVTQPLNSLETNADGRTDLDGAQVRTEGDQNYNDPVVLTTNVTIETSNVAFHGTVDSDTDNSWNLTINTNNGGLTRFRDDVGVTQPLNNLETNADGQTDLDGSQIVTAGDQDYRDPVILTTNVTIDTDNVTFHSMVDSDDQGPWNLTVDTRDDGTTWFQNDVGVSQPLNNLETNADGQTDLDGSQIVTAGDQDYRDPVILTTNVTIDTDNVTFHGTVDSNDQEPWNLTVNTRDEGLTWFRDDVGSDLPLNNLITNADGRTDLDGRNGTPPLLIQTVGDQDYFDPVVLITDVDIETQDARFHDTVNSGSEGPSDLVVNSAVSGETRFMQPVGTITLLGDLTTNADGETLLGSDGLAEIQVLTRGSQSYRDPVRLISHTSLETFTPAVGIFDVTFVQTVDSASSDPRDLQIDTVDTADGRTIFLGEVGGTNPIRDLDVYAGGTFEVIENITTSAGPATGDPAGDIFIEVVDRISTGDDIHVIERGGTGVPHVVVNSTGGAITMLAGDELIIDQRTAILAADFINLTVDTDSPDNDANQGGLLSILGAAVTDTNSQANVIAAPDIDLLGNDDNDIIRLQISRFRADDTIDVDGGNNQADLHSVDSMGETMRGAVVPGVCGGATADFEIISEATVIGDRVFFVDDDQLVGRDYSLRTEDLEVNGGPTFGLNDDEQIDVLGGAGDDTLRVFAPVLVRGRSALVRFDGNGQSMIAGEGDHLIINGSTDADSIIVNKFNNDADRATYEAENVEFLWLRGDAGNDFLANNTDIPSIIEGDGESVADRFDDTMIGGSDIDLIFAGRGEDVLLGRGGDDYLYADMNFLPPDSGVVYQSEGADETLGDVLDGGVGINSAVQIGELDKVIRITGKLLDGGACKDVFTWLYAQLLFVSSSSGAGSSVQEILDCGLKDLGVKLRDPISPPDIVQNFVAPTDVNADGELTPRDALIVLNLLNQIGPGKADDIMDRLNGGAEGEGPAQVFFDVNGDKFLSPSDAIMVINAINHRFQAQGEGEAVTDRMSESVQIAETPDKSIAPRDARPTLPASFARAVDSVFSSGESDDEDEWWGNL